MAGRGRAATLPAWMTAGGGAGLAAPGAPAAAAPTAAGAAAPGSVPPAALPGGLAAAPAVQPGGAAAAPLAAVPGGVARAPMVLPASLAPGGAALSPTALPGQGPASGGGGSGGGLGAPNTAAMAAAAMAAASAAASAAGVPPGGGALPSPGAPTAAGARPPAAAGPPGMAYPGMPPPMFQPPPGMPPGMAPPPGMPAFPGAPPGMPPFPGAPPFGMMPPPHMQQQPQQPAASAWSEHSAPDGRRKYYYNSLTRVSTWVKPDELMTPEERAKAAADKAAAAAAAAATAAQPATAQQAASAAAPAAAAGGAVSEVAKAWKQYTAPDGRPYFYNKITKESKWVQPEEMKAAQAAAAAGGGGDAKAAPATQVVPLSANGVEAGKQQQQQRPDPGPAPAPAKPIVYPNKEAAREAFRQLLSDMDVPPEASWDNAMRLIVNDPRYGALKALGEKKAAFNEYCTRRRASEREEARRRQVAAKEGFMVMLEECGELKVGDSYERAARLLNHDHRWKDLDSDPLRRELFKDHMDGLKRRRADEEKRSKEAQVSSYRDLLARSGLKASSTWRKVQAKLQDEPEFEALDRLSRLEVFQDFIRGLEEEERQARERDKEARRRQERRNRDAFRALLQQHRDEGRINARSRWKEYAPSVEEEEAYLAVKRNASGSRPRELFEDLILELEEEYDRVRSVLKEATKAAGWAAAADSAYPEYLEALAAAAAADSGADAAADADGGARADAAGEGKGGGAAANGPSHGGKGPLAAKLGAMRDSHKRLFFEEQVGRAKDKIADAERRQRRALDKFVSFMRAAEGLYATTTWEEFEEAFKEEDEFVAVGAEAAKRLFDEHIERLKAKEKERAERGGGGSKHGDEDDEGGAKRKKRSSRHDDDDHKKSKRHRRDRSRERSSRERSRDKSRDKSRDRKLGRSPESGEPEEGEV